MGFMTSRTNKITTADLAIMAMFTALIAICSWISIPAAIPFTLQTFGVFLALLVLGGKRGFLTVLTYLLLGAVGAPVFSSFTGGLGSFIGSTGGFLWGFLISALLMWWMEIFFGKRKPVLITSMVLGLLICYVTGTLWFTFMYTGDAGGSGLWSALTLCVFPYIIPDAIKLTLAYMVSKKLVRFANVNR